MNKQKQKQLQRTRRRVRVGERGTAERPRLSAFRSLGNIYAKIINDEDGATLVAASVKEIKRKMNNKTEAAKEVGRILAEKAKKRGIEKVVFDRGAYKYHGRIKALADGARDGGLKF